MSEVYEHNPGDHEDPLAGPTWTVGIAGAALLVVIVLGLVGLIYHVIDRERAVKVVEQPRVEIEVLDAEQSARLTGPVRREVRPENGGAESIVIPIDRAIELVVREGGGS